MPLKASLATSFMPFLVSRLSGGRGAKATNIKLLLPQSTRSVSILKRRFFHPFVLLAPRSQPFTLQRFDLKGSQRRVKPRRREELCVCVCFARARFHRREGSCYLWKHACVENNEINKIQFDTVLLDAKLRAAELLMQLSRLKSLASSPHSSSTLTFSVLEPF